MKLDLDRPVPGEREAQERAWAAVAAAHGAHEHVPSRRRRLDVRLAVATATVVLAAAGLAVTPPGEAVAEWLVRAVGADTPRPPVAPTAALPAPGQLLVDTPRGLAVVRRDGSRRDLGDWHDGGFSPRGRFVAAIRGRTLAALDLRGQVRWSLRRPFALAQPAWAPDGLHVAYRSGDGLRVVGGDGRRDRFLDGPIGPAAPVWLDARTVAWADARGRVHTVDAVTGRAGWVSERAAPVSALAAGDGLVAAMSRHEVRVLRGSDGTLSSRRGVPRRAELVAMAAGGARLAVIRHDPRHGLSHVELGPLSRAGRPEGESPALPGRVLDPMFSPDGRWLLLGWRVADEWLFLSAPARGKVAAVPGVGKRLAPASPGRWAFPRVVGWAPAP